MDGIYQLPRSAPTGGRQPALGGVARRPLQRPTLLFDVLTDYAQWGSATREDAVAGGPERRSPEEEFEVRPELATQQARASGLEAPHEGTGRRIRWKPHQEVHVVGFAVELDEFPLSELKGLIPDLLEAVQEFRV